MKENNLAEIYLAGGCFWGVEAYIMKINGVVETSVGYANGYTENPNYEEVCTGKTGFVETVKVVYDKNKLKTSELLEKFFQVIDPTTLNKQANDIGNQYRSGIYYVNSEEKSIIDEIIDFEQKKHIKPIVTEVLSLKNYYLAENYHQKYLEKIPNGYCHIKF